MTVATTIKLVLEPAAQEFADATANPPFLFDLGPEKGRETVDEVQSGEIGKPDVDDHRHHRARRPVRRGVGAHPASPRRDRSAAGDRLHPRRRLGVRQRAHPRPAGPRARRRRRAPPSCSPNYSLSPEAKYPTAIEESYAVAEWVAQHGAEARPRRRPGSRSPATRSAAT